MAKRCKKKAGLHKKVSTVFKGVSIPQREGDQQTSQTLPTDGPSGSSSISTPTGSLVSKSSLIKKVCRSKSPSNKAATGRKKTLLSKRKISNRSASKDSPVRQRTKTKRDEATLDHTVDVPSKQTNLDQLIPHCSKRKKSSKAKASSSKVKSDRTVKAPPRLTIPDDPIPQPDPVEDTPQNENVLDNAEPVLTVEAPQKLTLPDLSIPLHLPAEDTLQVKDSADNVAPDRTVGIPSWMMSPDYPDSSWNPTNEQTPSEDSSSQVESDDVDEVHRIDQDEPMPELSSVEEPQQAENVPDRITPRRKSWVPPRLTNQDHLISQGSPTSKPEQTENARDKAELGRTDNSMSQSASEKKLQQAENITDTSVPDRTAKTSPKPKSEQPHPSQDSDSEKRYGPVAPSRKAAPSGQQRETTVLQEVSGPSLWQQISNKLFSHKQGVNPTKQKVMVISIPILAIVMIFLFRQVLSKSPHKTKGASTNDVTLIAPVDANHEIDWQIPEPLPATLRDPTKPPAQNNTQNEEQNPTAGVTKAELIDIGTIVYSHDKQSAVVNGRIIHTGDTVSGVNVLKINKDSVEFEKNGEKWTQKIHD